MARGQTSALLSAGANGGVAFSAHAGGVVFGHLAARLRAGATAPPIRTTDDALAHNV
jgi:membrane associated rhomboid family serine protease